MDLARMAFDQAWQLTALVVVVWFTARIVARNRPHLAYVLWLVVLLKAMTPPVWSSPTGIFSWVQASLYSDAFDDSTLRADFDSRGSLTTIQRAPAIYETARATAIKTINKEAAARYTAASPKPDSSRAATLSVRQGLAVIWFSGLLATFLVTVMRWAGCVRMLRHAPAVDRHDLEELVTELSRQLRVRRRVGLLVTTSRIGPAVIGLLRPLIVLPEIIVRGKRAKELESIIAHELLHVRRGDLWLGLLQVGTKAAWWFHPLVWCAGRMSTREAERCCDEEVIGELRCDPKQYARSLLEILELKRTLRTVPAVPGMKPVEVTSQRLERIMQLGQGCHKRAPRWCWAVLLLLAASTLPGAALIFATDEPVLPAPLANGSSLDIGVGVPADAADVPMIEIAVEFLRAPQEVVDAAIAEWLMPPGHDNSPSDTNRKLPAKPKSIRIVGARLPLVHKVLDDQKSATIAQAIAKDRRSSELAAPRVAVFDRRSASVKDTVRRPFVVGFRPDGEPQIRQITEGITLHVRPELLDEGRLRLSYDLQVSQIAEIQTSTFRIDGRDEPLTLQVPVVEINESASSASFQLGETLLIGGISIKDNLGKPQAMLVMLKATRRPSAIPTGRLKFGRGVNSDADIAGAVRVDNEDLETQDEATLEQRLNQPITLNFSRLPMQSAMQRMSSEPTVAVCYDVADLLKEDLNWLDQPEVASGKYDSREQRTAEILIASIIERVEPQSWHDVGGPGDIAAFLSNHSLVVSQTERGHNKLTAFLQDIRARIGIASKARRLTPIRSTHLAATKLSTRVYNVADLVTPVPSVIREPKDLPRYGEVAGVSLADFDTLLDLITSTLAPDSWDKVGGPGAIEAFSTNLSLVVSQNAEVHEQIADLLEQLRRLQDVQITIESKIISVPKSFFARSEIPGFDVSDFPVGDASAEIEVGKPIVLSEIEAFFLHQAIERFDDSKLIAVPKITLFNGQQAIVSTKQQGVIPSTLQFGAVCSSDRRAVHLVVATDAETEINLLPRETITSGGSLLVRLDDSAAAAGSNPQHEMPYESRLFKNTPKPAESIPLLLVTPRVVVLEEEEEVANVRAGAGD